MKSLFASIQLAASRSLLLTVTPAGLRILGVATNFLNPLGVKVEWNTLGSPALFGVNLTNIFSSDLAPIR